jgi:hypothetical protein
VTRPGLAKARGLPLVCARPATLVRAPDPPWRELFDRADVVSEGSVREERSGRVWYGSTSLILDVEPLAVDPPWVASLATIAARDIHVRLRALRTAHREACLRAPGRLGRFTCEMRVVPDDRGVRIDVDVQAPFIEGRAHSRAVR